MRILILALCVGLVGCNSGEIKIPKKTITAAEANETYDMEKFTKVRIPSNCRAVGISTYGRILIENGSGTQFIIAAPGDGFATPVKFVPDMPELW